MPRVDELLDRLGTARFYSILDLTKGYWQIPLTPMSREKTAFTTPFGLHQFVTLPFGLFGAPATFLRLMDQVLRPHQAYAAAYIDDIIIYSDNAAYAKFKSGPEITACGWAHSQLEEVCNWTSGGTVFGVPLGSWTGAAPN